MIHERPTPLSISRALGKVVVTPHHALDNDTTPLLHQCLLDLIDGQGNLDVVVDFRHISSIEGEAIVALVGTSRLMKRHGGRLVISQPRPHIHGLLDRAGLEIEPLRLDVRTNLEIQEGP